MRGFVLDEKTADALLNGRIVDDDAPPGYQDVARLVRAARAPATAGELATEEHVVASLAAGVREGTGVSGPGIEGRRPMLTKLLSAKAAAALAVAVVGGSAAAAATGSLPAPLQSGVSHGLTAVGISVPDPGASPSATTDGTVPSSTPQLPPTQAVGPSASGPALSGLCTAYAASSGSQSHGHSVAFRNLEAAAANAGQTVTEYCAAASTTTTTTTTTTGPSDVTTTVPPSHHGNGNPGGPPSSIPASSNASPAAGAGRSNGSPGGPPSSRP